MLKEGEFGLRPGGIENDPRLTPWMQDLPRVYIDLDTTLDDIPDPDLNICGCKTEKAFVPWTFYSNVDQNPSLPTLVVFFENAAGYQCEGGTCLQDGEEAVQILSDEALLEMEIKAADIFEQIGDAASASSFKRRARKIKDRIDKSDPTTFSV